MVKRVAKTIAGVVLLLLGLYFAAGAVVATAVSRVARFTNLLMLIPAVFMIIMAVVLFRMARD